MMQHPSSCPLPLCRPELRGTSALVYAVRLGRPGCVAALLSCSLQHLNMPDGWGHTPLAYASYMLARDKNDVTRQLIMDLLLDKLPQVRHDQCLLGFDLLNNDV